MKSDLNSGNTDCVDPMHVLDTRFEHPKRVTSLKSPLDEMMVAESRLFGVVQKRKLCGIGSKGKGDCRFR